MQIDHVVVVVVVVVVADAGSRVLEEEVVEIAVAKVDFRFQRAIPSGHLRHQLATAAGWPHVGGSKGHLARTFLRATRNWKTIAGPLCPAKIRKKVPTLKGDEMRETKGQKPDLAIRDKLIIEGLKKVQRDKSSFTYFGRSSSRGYQKG